MRAESNRGAGAARCVRFLSYAGSFDVILQVLGLVAVLCCALAPRIACSRSECLPWCMVSGSAHRGP